MVTPNQRLRQARELRGWSQAKVAEQIGTDATTVSRWERGLFSPTPYFREKLCELFGKNAEELGFLETQERPQEQPEPVSERQEQLLFSKEPLVLSPPSWPKHTDTFAYILQSAAYDEQAHMLWEDAYVRALQGQHGLARQFGEASLKAFEQVGHVNAVALREWLKRQNLTSSPPPAHHVTTAPAPRVALTKIPGREQRRSARSRGLSFLLLLIMVAALLLSGFTFNQLHLSGAPEPQARHDGRPLVANATFTPSSFHTSTVPATTSTATVKVTPTLLSPRNCSLEPLGYRCTLTLWIFANKQSVFTWQASSRDVLARFNPVSGSISPGQPFQIIVYLQNEPGQRGVLIFFVTVPLCSCSNSVVWQG